jgi:phosphate transport system protein
MFKWLKRVDPEKSGLGKMLGQFGRMLEDGEKTFALGASAYLGGADAESVPVELVSTDQNINRLERKIRREIVVHAMVHGASEFPFCLVLMSIVKDAERIGDYAKNILDLGRYRPKAPGGPYQKRLTLLTEQIAEVLQQMREIYESQDTDAAAGFIEKCEILKDVCDDGIEEILIEAEPRSVDPADPAATALCYRYFKRVISHARNIVTSIVVPVDKLDYFDESDETKDIPPPI